MPVLCEQFTHRSADTIGVFPVVACTAHWAPEVLYSRALKPWSRTSPDCQPSNVAILSYILAYLATVFCFTFCFPFFYHFRQL